MAKVVINNLGYFSLQRIQDYNAARGTSHLKPQLLYLIYSCLAVQQSVTKETPDLLFNRNVAVQEVLYAALDTVSLQLPITGPKPSLSGGKEQVF